MEDLFNKLYNLYVHELLNLNLGYSFNEQSLNKMSDLINVIEFIRQSNPTSEDIIKILEYYESNL